MNHLKTWWLKTMVVGYYLSWFWGAGRQSRIQSRHSRNGLSLLHNVWGPRLENSKAGGCIHLRAGSLLYMAVDAGYCRLAWSTAWPLPSLCFLTTWQLGSKSQAEAVLPSMTWSRKSHGLASTLPCWSRQLLRSTPFQEEGKETPCFSTEDYQCHIIRQVYGMGDILTQPSWENTFCYLQ